MFGIPIEGATNCYIDNDSVVSSSTQPESTLKKRHLAIAYHRVREAVAAGIVRIAYEASSTNIADMLTKILPAENYIDCVNFAYFRLPGFSLIEGFSLGFMP